MAFLLIAAVGQVIFKLLLGGVAVFLILLVLVQRGRGGGLAGALGGMGGSSAFGAKAGDVFTRVTIVAASIWIMLCIAAAKMGPSSDSRIDTKTASPASVPAVNPFPMPRGEESEETTDAEAETSAGNNADIAAPESSSAADQQPSTTSDSDDSSDDSGDVDSGDDGDQPQQ